MRLGYASVHTGDNGNSGPAQLDAYRFVLNDEIFRNAVKHNLLLLISVPVVLVLALAIALILHEGIMGWRVYRTVVFVPYILAIPVLGTTFIYLLSLERRAELAARRRRPRLPRPGLARIARRGCCRSIAGIIIYHELGFGVVLFLARLLSLPEEVDQAARIDGCNWWQLRRRITLPADDAA